MKVIETNVMLIGKSGVGKSSLINYLFDTQVEKTGTGSPVTQGFNKHILRLSNDIVVNIYDSWGLEPDKSREWNAQLEEKLRECDAASIEEWIHTILFCMSAKSSRIDDFEIEIINKLVEKKNNIIVVLTHCDISDSTSIEAMKKVLYEKCRIDKSRIICVGSVGQKLISGLETERFGKKEVLIKVREGLWENICEKVPLHLKEYVDKKVNSLEKECIDYARSQIKIYNMHSDKNYKSLNSYCNDIIKKRIDEIIAYCDVSIEHAIWYYLQIEERIRMITKNELKVKKINYNRIIYSMSFGDKVLENAASVVMLMIPLVGLAAPWAAADAKRDEYAKEISSIINEIKIEMYKYIDESCLQNLNVNNES